MAISGCGKLWLVILILSLETEWVTPARNRSHRLKKVLDSIPGGNGSPLLLTPFILSDKIEEAKEMSRVTMLQASPECGDSETDLDLQVESYSGFLTVNAQLNSNLFFWFVPALENRESAPVVLWLNGGPGTTSLVAFFNEHGPFMVEEDMTLSRRNVTWISTHSIIYMDSPVGAGFSFTDFESGYPRSIDDVTRDLHLAIQQFFIIFHEYQTQDFYVAGQSYAGKYAPALAYKIHQVNQNSPEKRINLKGISVGSGFFDPATQLNYADFYYQVGVIDEYQRDYFEQQEQLTRDFIEARNWTQAFVVLESLIVGYPTPYGISHFEKITGLKYNLNILMEEEPTQNHYFVRYVRQDSVRRALHVGNQKFYKFNPKVYNSMSDDIYQSVKPKLIELLNADYKILIYASQFDAIVPYTTINNFINALSWKNSDEYSKADKQIWRVGPEYSLAGYKKKAGKFIFVMLRNSGHLAAQDQPAWTFDMINKFTRDEL